MSVFQEVMTSYFEYYLKDFMTAIPAVVVSVNKLSQGMIAVKPSINKKTKDGRVYEWPEILDVPVVFPSSSFSAVTFPIAERDTVLLVFSMKGLDEWRGGTGGPATPVDYRHHDIRDAIAIPCVWPSAKSVNSQTNRTLPHSVNDLVVSHNTGTGREAEVRIDPAGKVSITSPLEVEINSPITTINSNIVMNGNHTVNGTFTYNGEEYSLHRHIGVQPGDGTSGPKA